MAVYTDIADEIYSKGKGEAPAGVRLSTSRSGAITLTRVQITRPGLARPMGRYVTPGLPRRAGKAFDPPAAAGRAGSGPPRGGGPSPRTTG